MSKNSEMLSTMIVIATLGHDGQFDKGGKPYILHPMKVAHYLKTDDLELMCMAIGHDLIEDCSGKTIIYKGVPMVISYSMLREVGMSERVIDGIRCGTKVPGETYAEYKEKVFSNRDTMLWKRCDLRHNSDIRRLKGVTEKDVARIAKYMEFYTEIESRVNSTK